MGIALLALGYIGFFACWIFVLIKMFKNEKPLIGILGILCGLWAFIWGWMNATKLGLKNIMIIWSIAWVVAIIGQVMATSDAVAKARLQQQQTIPMTPAP